MCRGHDMNVLVMDVEGTDGRERGEDQVRLHTSVNSSHLNPLLRTLNASQRYSPIQLTMTWRYRYCFCLLQIRRQAYA